jgi:hypothetical protein
LKLNDVSPAEFTSVCPVFVNTSVAGSVMSRHFTIASFVFANNARMGL